MDIEETKFITTEAEIKQFIGFPKKRKVALIATIILSAIMAITLFAYLLLLLIKLIEPNYVVGFPKGIFYLPLAIASLCIFINVNKKAKNSVVNQFVEEVEVMYGEDAKKQFVNDLTAVAKENIPSNQKIEKFNALLKQVHDDYISKRENVYTKEEFLQLCEKVKIAIWVANNEGKNIELDDPNKNNCNAMLAKLDGYYKVRNFFAIKEIYEKYSGIYQEYAQKRQASLASKLEYNGKSTFDGMLIQKIGYDILCGFLIVITLGLAYPATLCIKQKWYAKHTVYDGQRLYFDGKGIQLFGLWILWWFLSIITCGIFALVLPKKILAWKTKHTHVCCENKEFGSEFKGSGVVYVLLLIGLSLLNVITLSIAVPFTTCWHIKWVAKHTSLDGRRIAFDGKGIQLLGKWILWAFLTLITVGIYGFFLSIKMEKWKVSHTHFID